MLVKAALGIKVEPCQKKGPQAFDHKGPSANPRGINGDGGITHSEGLHEYNMKVFVPTYPSKALADAFKQ